LIRMSDYADIEHRFDERFYRTTLKKRVAGYLAGAFEQMPLVEGLEHLAEIPPGTNRVYTALHKSHLDYIIIPYMLAIPLQQQPPAIAAGDNLFKKFGPLDFDKWIRESRGYKIIRTPADERERRTVLKQLLNYTSHLFGNKEDILLFPEGGRSYTGRTQPFKDAALSIMISAARGAARPVAFVPTDVSYERVPEDRFFPVFQAYKNNPSWFRKAGYYALDWPMIFAQQFFNKTLGTAVLRFGKPYIYAQDSGEKTNGIKKIISGLLTERCNSLVEITPTALFSRACAQQGESLDKVLRHMEDDAYAAAQAGRHISCVKYRSIPQVADRAVRFLNAPFRRFVTMKDAVHVRRPDVVQYYANTIAHLFSEAPAPVQTKAF
jgi:glycerol-3-phosphate O-acyltransferase